MVRTGIEIEREKRDSFDIVQAIFELAGQQERNPGIAHDELAALGRKLRIERNVRPARLEDGEQRDHRGFGSFDHDADPLLGPEPAADQVMGKTIGFGVERSERKHITADGNCRSFRMTPRMCADRLMHQRQCDGRYRVAIAVIGKTGVNRRDRIDAAKQHRRVPRQRRQQMLELHPDLLGLRWRKMARHIGVFDLKRVLDEHRQVHRIVRHVDILQATELQRAVSLLQHAAFNRIVFEYDDAVEHRLAGAAGPALNVIERRVLDNPGSPGYDPEAPATILRPCLQAMAISITGNVLMKRPSICCDPSRPAGRPATVTPKVTVCWPV